MGKRWKWYQSRIKNLRPEQWSFLAGVVDCDGCITYYKEAKSWRVKLSNTNKKFVEHLSKLINIPNIYSQTRFRGDRWNRKTIYSLEIVAKREVLDFLKNVIPYLIIKKSVAKKALSEMRKRLNE